MTSGRLFQHVTAATSVWFASGAGLQRKNCPPFQVGATAVNAIRDQQRNIGLHTLGLNRVTGCPVVPLVPLEPPPRSSGTDVLPRRSSTATRSRARRPTNPGAARADFKTQR